MPSPEQLGVVASQTTGGDLDWNLVDRRLRSLGAVCFQMSQLPGDRWRVTCLLPTVQPERTHHVESEANTRAEAVRSLLDQAEKWAALR
jgi:hypothetical protein